eukprot:scaffold72874_cov30-Tisochrysis_lutea.AAC.2
MIVGRWVCARPSLLKSTSAFGSDSFQVARASKVRGASCPSCRRGERRLRRRFQSAPHHGETRATDPCECICAIYDRGTPLHARTPRRVDEPQRRPDRRL